MLTIRAAAHGTVPAFSAVRAPAACRGTAVPLALYLKLRLLLIDLFLLKGELLGAAVPSTAVPHRAQPGFPN